jgi:hypothetical protein
VVRGGLITLSMLAGVTVPASAALAADRPTPDSGGIGIRLVDAATVTSGNPLARSYIVDRLVPGTDIRRRVEISNSTDATADVAVYPAAANVRQGRFGFAPGRRQNELSSWTSVSQDVLHLSPHTKALETVSISVPKRASAGERYAVIWAEVSAPAPAAGGVTLVNRVGVRIYLTVGSGGALRSSFTIGALTATRSTTGEPLVIAAIHNNGRRTLEISGALTLSGGPGGLRAEPFPVTLATALAPDDSELLTVRLDKQLPRGPWQARLLLRSGPIHREAAATITFPRRAGEPRAVPAVSRHLIVVAIAILALLAVAAAALLLARRASRKPRP